MTDLRDELLEVADRLAPFVRQFSDEEMREPAERLRDSATRVGKAWSQSWIGYHANVYYADLQPPPPGARFSVDWGFMRGTSVDHTLGEWEEYDANAVKATIYERAGNPDLSPLERLSDVAASALSDLQPEVLSILEALLAGSPDQFLSSLRDKVIELRVMSAEEISRAMQPNQFATRDSSAAGQGIRTPPHVDVLAQVMALEQPLYACDHLARACSNAAAHIRRTGMGSEPEASLVKKVFIGHGSSPAWREVKDFIQDRLLLSHEEFNRVTIAGISTQDRLSQMLDEVSFALLVMTGEDEDKDGKLRARMNVVHEAGLFQGRLGFKKAIVLLEEGCEEFSNIHGLGQIRFPKGQINAAFEEIRRVLEREGLLGVPG